MNQQMHDSKLNIIKVFLLIIVLILAIPFYLFAIDGPYTLDKKLDQRCPSEPPQSSYWIRDKCYRHSIIMSLNEKLERIFGIYRWTIYDFEKKLFLMFLPILLLYSNFIDYADYRLRKINCSFSKMYGRSALFLIITGGIGLIPSIILSGGCLGEFCFPMSAIIVLFMVVTLILGLLSSAIFRVFMKNISK